VKIVLLDSKDPKKWDEVIIYSQEGTFGHLSGWTKVYELYGYKPYNIAAVDGSDTIKGVLRFFLTRDIFGKKFLISNPFISYGGICAYDNETKNALISKAKEIALENRVQYFEVRQLAHASNALPAKKDFVTLLLRLEKCEEFIWKNSLETAVRNQIRKAIKLGLTVNFGTEYFDDFYRVLSINHRDFGTPLHKRAFFKKVLDEFNERAGIIVVKHQGKVIAGMLYIHYKNVFSEPWASSLREYNKLCPNNLLYWEAIKYACKHGFEYFDFGRSTIGSGTFNFKKQWGADPVQLHYQYFLNKANKIPVHNVHDNKYQLAINVWKKMPMIIANIIGPRLVKYLPEL